MKLLNVNHIEEEKFFINYVHSISRRLITKKSIINNRNTRVTSYMSSILEKAL